MNVSTHTKVVKVHTILVDDAEIEAHLDDAEYWQDQMRELLLRKVEPANGNGHKPKRKRSTAGGG